MIVRVSMLSSKPHFFPHNFLRHRVACVMIGGIEGSMPSSKPLLEGSMLSSKPLLEGSMLSSKPLLEGSMLSSKPLLEGSMLSSKPHLFAYKLSVGALYGSVLTGAVCSELIQLSE